MRYFVLAPNGERYGPADVATLTEWANSSRLYPNSRVMEEMSGTVFDASSIPGIQFPPASPMAPPPPGTPYVPTPPAPGMGAYPRPGYVPSIPGDNGKKEMWMAFGMALAAPVVGLLLIYGIFIAIAGVGSAWRAYQKGQSWAMLALILNVIAVPIAFYMRFILRYQLMSHY
jgi:hypothetical protein